MGLEVKCVESEEEECVTTLWSGGVHVALDCPPELAWAVFADFGGLCEWNPAVMVCDTVERERNAPGSVRYCRGRLPDSWVYERLLVRDEKKRLCKYRMEANRFRFQDGVQGYVAQIQFRDVDEGKTFVDWTYTVQPAATQTYEQFTKFMTGFYLFNLSILQSAANVAVRCNLEPQEQSQKQSSVCNKLVNSAWCAT